MMLDLACPAAASRPSAASCPHPALRVQLPWLALTWVTVVLALYVAKGQVSLLASSQLDDQHKSWSLAALTGWSAWVSRTGWETFGQTPFRRTCLVVYLVLDVVLVLLLAAALRHYLVVRVGASTKVASWLSAVPAGLVLVVDALTCWVGIDVASPGRAAAVAGASTGAGILVTLTAAVVAWDFATRKPLRPRLRSAYEIVRLHRLTILPVAVLGLLLVAPGASILDQVPDIERRWANGFRNLAIEGTCGFLIMFVAAGALLVLGRGRVAIACRTFEQCPVDPLPGPRTWPWVLTVLGVVTLGGILNDSPAGVAWGRLALFCAVPTVVALSSVALQVRESRGHPAPAGTVRLWSLSWLQRALVTGDVLALGVLALAAIGAVRALTPVVVLQTAGRVINGVPQTGPPKTAALAWVVLGVGVLGVLFVWFCLHRLYRRAGDRATSQPGSWTGRMAAVLGVRPGEQDPAILHRLPRVVLGASLLSGTVIGCFPTVIGHGGVILVFVGGILTLTGLVSGVTLLAAKREPAPLFRLLRLRSTPMIWLLLAAVVFAGQVDDSTPIHRIRDTRGTGLGASLVDRPDLTTLIDQWAAGQTDGCRSVDPRTGVQLLPMVLLATEGGGIRATYWTVGVTDKMAADRCTARSTLLSSGVSGGAVGLAVARSVGSVPTAAGPDQAADGGQATQVVENMSNSRALSSGLAGLLVRDFAYAVTGLPLPLAGPPDQDAFVDRGALIEEAWADSDDQSTGWNGTVFSSSRTDGRSVVGAVVLNSMSVGNACRVWVSEVELATPDQPVDSRDDGKIDCDDVGRPGLRSIDLLSAYGSDPQAVGGGDAECLVGLRIQTAALLAARFPYVTPSGHLSPCEHPTSSARPVWTAPTDQLVDGGYLENTGLGTLTDTSDDWLPAVQAWNAEHAHPAAGEPRRIIQPVVVYLDNDTGSDQSPPDRDVTSEGLLPALAWSRAKGSDDDATMQRAADAVDPVRVCDQDTVCLTALQTTPHTFFDVYPGSTPQISAPLGWILSQSSRSAMDNAIRAQAQKDSCAARHDGHDVVTSAGSLCDLLELTGKR